MRKWLQAQFKDAPTAIASAMAVAGGLGTLSCSAIICIVFTHRMP